MRRRSFLLRLAALAAALAPLHADGLSEAQVKAAFILNFIRFVEWPPAAFAADSDPIVVGILGQGAVVDAVDGLGGKPVRGRSLVVKHFARPQDVQACHVLFISASAADRVAAAIGFLGQGAALTISEVDGGLPQDVVINLFVADTRVAFDVNLAVAARSRLQVSSRLLAIARRVEKGGTL